VDENLKATNTIFYNSMPLYNYFKKKPIRDLTELDIRKYKKWRRKTFKQEKDAIERLTIKVPKKVSRTEEYIPSIAETDRIIKYLPKHLYEFAFCAHRLGYRGSEFLGLTFGNIPWTEREIRLPTSKNKHGRNTPLYKEINDFLKLMYDEAAKIFGRKNLNDVI
jgi:hypothetical protein